MTGPIDAGKSMIFYIGNDCPEPADAMFPTGALVFMAGHNVPVQLRLNRNLANPVEQVTMSWPSKVEWLGIGRCTP